jgi:transporter family-2 protein
MKYILMAATFLVGAVIPIQAVLNARLGQQTGGALMGALLSFITGTFCLLALNLMVNSAALVHLKPFTTTPWYIWLGGLIGAIFVAFITWVNVKQSFALTFALVVAGQIFISLLIDHFGLLGATVSTINLQKIIGAALIIAGVILIKK